MKKFTLCAIVALALVSCGGSDQKANSAPQPADNNATPRTTTLLAKLHSIWNDNLTMFGHQDDTVYGLGEGEGWRGDTNRSDVKSVAGDYPALFGWELGHIELGRTHSLDSVAFDQIRSEIITADARGGINTISWHLRNPLNDSSSWDKTHGTVAAILTDKTIQTKYLNGLDILCDFFLSLTDKNGELVPVLFRPFHEHSGSWFWWGSDFCTIDEYTALWRLTVNHIKARGVNNLLYVYSPDKTTNDEYFERYPGDDMIDILGLDSYHRGAEATAEEFITSTIKTLAYLREEAQKRGKISVFSETGLEGLAMDSWFTDVTLRIVTETSPAYVLVWRNADNQPGHFYAPYVGHPSAPAFIEFTNAPNILMLNDIK